MPVLTHQHIHTYLGCLWDAFEQPLKATLANCTVQTVMGTEQAMTAGLVWLCTLDDSNTIVLWNMSCYTLFMFLSILTGPTGPPESSPPRTWQPLKCNDHLVCDSDSGSVFIELQNSDLWAGRETPPNWSLYYSWQAALNRNILLEVFNDHDVQLHWC